MLSIIIPTLNEEKYLPKLLKSIKSQTFKDYEIIVVDNNSKDKTRTIAKKFGCKVVKGGEHPGISRNRGSRKAKGNLLLFMDADCEIHKGFLKNAVNEIKTKNLDIAGCKVMPLSNRIDDNIAFSIYNSWIIATQLFYANASGHGIFCNKKLHNKIKGFNENIRLSEDMDYCKRANKIGKFRILKSTIIHTSTRRFDYYGRFNTYLKLLLSAFYRPIFGEIKSNIFNYRFNYKK